MRQFNRQLNNALKKNNERDSTIQLKDILIPLLSAMVAVGLNQFFFQSNKVVESKIEILRENYRAQRPILNRILAFTYKWETTQVNYKTIHFYRYIYKDPKTGKVIKEEKVPITEKPNDYASVTVPSFISDSSKRNKFLEDLETIKKQQDQLDHTIYVVVDELFDFIENHKFPSLTNDQELIDSVWRDSTVQKNWLDLNTKLRNVCGTKINEFENSTF